MYLWASGCVCVVNMPTDVYYHFRELIDGILVTDKDGNALGMSRVCQYI